MLENFYASARTKDGKLYSKASLMGIHAAIQRYIQGPPFNRQINLISGVCFAQANSVIQGAIKMMRKEGLDKAARHLPIPPEDLVKIYESGAFALDTPTTLQNKVYFEVTLHFGRRGREGLRELQKDSIVCRKDAAGNEYATLTSIAHKKNHQGMTSHPGNEHIQRMYATNKPKCPVLSLKFITLAS